MSRIGKRILTIPEKVTVSFDNNIITVKGPLGELKRELGNSFDIKIEESNLELVMLVNTKENNVMHGTNNALIKNMLEGVSKSFIKSLEIVGVGYRFQLKGNTLVVNAGHSKPDEMEIPSGLSVKVVSNTEIEISGIDKVLVGEFAANVRKIRKPEPYKGKGIRYKGEVIRRKVGKKASK